MKISRMAIMVAATAILMLATATSAFAAASTTGTVYGQATMTPTISIAVSGTGSSSGTPLIYTGKASQTQVAPTGSAQFIVTNNGASSVALYCGYGANPTDGTNTWALATAAGSASAKWTSSKAGEMFGVVVPGSSEAARAIPGAGTVAAGTSASFDTFFDFPTTYQGGTFNMSMLISAQ